jgi:hypothetical protein
MRKQDKNALLRLAWEAEGLEQETKEWLAKKLRSFLHCIEVKDGQGACALAEEIAKMLLKQKQ